jgi:cysteinyl-tRNA synthetase
MEKSRNGFIKSLRYLCVIGVFTVGLMAIVASGGGGGGSGDGAGNGGGTQGKGTIQGVVEDATTQNPIGNASVSVQGMNLNDTTDTQGHYAIADVPEGTQTVVATATGYTSQSKSVNVIANATATVDFSLTPSTATPINYRQEMRDFVQAISSYAKGIKPGFIIIPQNGHELLTENGEETGTLSSDYLRAIDGVGREDLYFGYDDDNVATPESEREYMIAFLDIAEQNGVEVLVTDYCWTESHVDYSYEQNADKGYISFAADHRELDNIPAYPAAPFNVNNADVHSLASAKNFLYLLNSGTFISKSEFVSAIQGTDYDILIIDLFYDGTEQLTTSDVESLKSKANRGTRLAIAYMSIGEAEDYRYYWQNEWEINSPSWLGEENQDWPGNYKVRYWDESWKSIIYGNDNSYLKKIIDAGFDGVYLDIIDAFEYFEGE